jgi:hypothetical protein
LIFPAAAAILNGVTNIVIKFCCSWIGCETV